MSQQLTLELSDELYAALQQRAESTGTSPARVATAVLEAEIVVPTKSEAERQAARDRFRRHFGSVDLGRPTGVDNESIDADLAREYGATHEGD
jgi:alkanesulfonate monooxygenase SsuD/methylene tetrahydromethanopterin reductase-like flavin-dependent oxidoreductase (luciferase family)